LKERGARGGKEQSFSSMSKKGGRRGRGLFFLYSGGREEKECGLEKGQAIFFPWERKRGGCLILFSRKGRKEKKGRRGEKKEKEKGEEALCLALARREKGGEIVVSRGFGE